MADPAALGLLYFAQDAQVAHWMRNNCARNFMCNICTSFAQVTTFFCQCAIYAQDFRKIFSTMRNICVRFAQDCTYFPNVQYMRKIVLFPQCARLYFFLQCATYAQDCTYFPNAQYMLKIVLISPMRNICADLCKITFHSSMCKMCARLYFFPLFDLFSPTSHV